MASKKSKNSSAKGTKKRAATAARKRPPKTKATTKKGAAKRSTRATATRSTCTITNRRMGAAIVFAFLARRGFPNAGETTRTDGMATESARALWATPLSDDVRARGCDPTGFTSSDTRNAQTVGAIIDALWAAIRANSRARRGIAKTRAKRPTKKRGAKRAAAAAVADAGATTAIAVAARRRRGLAPTAVCTLTNRGMVARLVLDFLRDRGFPDAGESSDFENDVIVTATGRALWANALADRVRARGCDASGFTSDDTRNAETVGEIVSALWEAIRA